MKGEGNKGCVKEGGGRGKGEEGRIKGRCGGRVKGGEERWEVKRGVKEG